MVGFEAVGTGPPLFRHLISRSSGDAPNEIDHGLLAAIPLRLVMPTPVPLAPLLSILTTATFGTFGDPRPEGGYK